MTDLYDEWWTQRAAIIRARSSGGDVLITGLGLGMVVEAILATPAPAHVRHVTVVEQSPDVIGLVAAQLQAQFGERLQIVEADAYTWVPDSGRVFDTVWHDIWPDPDAPEVDQQIQALRSHYQRWSLWQGFWPLDYRAALAEKG
jgi:spermidine synthase